MTQEITRKPLRKHDRQKIILIIDDDEGIREMLKEAFADSPALVKFASTAERGIAASDVFVVDVIITDIFMPGKGGIWGIAKLKARHPNAVIISISGGWKGMSPERAIKAAKTIGAHFGFAKPFDLWTVHDLVCDVLDEDPRVLEPLNLAPIKGFGGKSSSQTAVK